MKRPSRPPLSRSVPPDATSSPVYRKQRDAWNELATEMRDFSLASSTRYYKHCEMTLIRRAFGELTGRRVLKLDLWNEAFNTRILPWIAEQGAEAWGIDVSAGVAHRAYRNAVEEGSEINLVHGDIRQLPFADASFDYVYTMGTIEHMDEYREAVCEIYRVLRPGGRAVIGVPYKYDPWLRPLLVYVMDRFGKYPYSPEKSFSSRELRDVVEGAGLRFVERTGILTLPGIVRMADLFMFTRGIPLHRLMGVVVWPFDQLESRFRWPGRFGYLLTHIAEKPP